MSCEPYESQYAKKATQVKICGITREADVGFLNEYLPDYAGFVFAQSKRQVSPSIARKLSSMLDGRIKKVGVFVNEDIQKVVETVRSCKLDAAQLHGDETVEYVEALMEEIRRKAGGIEVWKAIRIKDRESLKALEQYPADTFVLDSFKAGQYGGTGDVFNWKLAASLDKKYRIILGGGLNKDNVKLAISAVDPFGVDVSSGVERDGFKDEGLIAELIQKVRT